MTERELLIELIASGVCEAYSPTCDKWQPHYCGGCYANDVHLVDLADHLLSNGVIVPPCKVGDKTFLLLEKTTGGYDILEGQCMRICNNGYSKVYSMYVDCLEIDHTLECRLDDFGKTVFLTHEEAEKALAERKKDNG